MKFQQRKAAVYPPVVGAYRSRQLALLSSLLPSDITSSSKLSIETMLLESWLFQGLKLGDLFFLGGESHENGGGTYVFTHARRAL